MGKLLIKYNNNQQYSKY